MIIMMTAAALAQDTAYVPFRVNVNAKITAKQGAETFEKNLTGRTTGADTLKLPLSGTNSARYRSGAQGQSNAPAVISNSRGNIVLRLPEQPYQNAEIALYSVNGKRILKTASGVSRRNVSAGVYIIKVSGINGNTFTTRVTHNGGNLKINAAFGIESVPPARQLGQSAAAGDWAITVSAAGYKDSAYTLNIKTGINTRQDITLTAAQSGNTFIDSRDGKTYKKVTIGTQTWMAENLNYDIPNVTTDVCYNNRPDSCAKYGRLYNWNDAKSVCPAGWHLPSDAEWAALETFAGGSSAAGRKLKSASGWNNNGNGTDEFGFKALPGGDGYSNGSFNYIGAYGGWWCAAENDAGAVLHRNMDSSYDEVRSSERYPDGLFSVRCVED